MTFKGLYGNACPQELCTLYNVSFQAPAHWVPAGHPTSVDALRDQFTSAITNCVLRSEGHPVLTLARAFQFVTSCKLLWFCR
eukprot:4809755-Amphidinium_carterae.1